MPREKRICNICGGTEPPKHGDPTPEECGGHVGIHYSFWNLSPERDSLGNRCPSYKDYQRFLAKKQGNQ